MSTKTVEGALATARLRHSELCSNAPEQKLSLCSTFWLLMFDEYYGEAPNGDKDPRWDHLFKHGFPLLRALDGSPP